MTTETTPRDAAALDQAEARAEIEAAATGLPVVVRFSPVIELTENQLLEFCAMNDLRIERNARGELEIMPPSGWESTTGESTIFLRLGVWAEQDRRGTAVGPTAGFKLGKRAMRAPDAAWLSHARLERVPLEDRRGFLPACPEFVVELRSRNDRLVTQRAKMEEWLAHGVQLGWLIDPIVGRVHVYRPGVPPEVLDRPDSISGDPLLPGFVLDLREVW